MVSRKNNTIDLTKGTAKSVFETGLRLSVLVSIMIIILATFEASSAFIATIGWSVVTGMLILYAVSPIIFQPNGPDG